MVSISNYLIITFNDGGFVNGTTNNDRHLSSTMEDIRSTRPHLFTNIGRVIYPDNMDSFTNNCYGDLGANRDSLLHWIARVQTRKQIKKHIP